MEKKQAPIHALVLDADPTLSRRGAHDLAKKYYATSTVSSKEEALNTLKTQSIQLAVLGNPPKGGVCFDLLKDFVKTSPLTSLTLTAYTSEKEIPEKAECFGILGNVFRS
jgi:DNA-binding response OmpR family regulator